MQPKYFSPVTLALLGTLFTWFLTALGSSLVFFFKEINRKVLDGMLGFAAGVMIAASFWSLLNPSIVMAEKFGMIPWIPAVVGFLSGGVFLRIIDMLLPHLHMFEETPEGIKTKLKRSFLLVLAITLHNIPEGLAIGFAFGYLGHANTSNLLGTIALVIGIGLQNFPEGAAISIPLRREGLSRWKSFLFGQASGIVEPIAAVAAASLSMFIKDLLPYALSFAAGAMIFVVVEELIPESQAGGHPHIATMGTMLGFALMMLLDVALG